MPSASAELFQRLAGLVLEKRAEVFDAWKADVEQRISILRRAEEKI